MPLSSPASHGDLEPVSPIELDDIVAHLRTVREDWRQSQARHAEYGEHGFPSRHAIARIVDLLSAVLFPLRLGP
ncbi:MAG TPA: serine acetyltransferase, partial [Novosphingobium sp.]